jgi:hypothetical protein
VLTDLDQAALDSLAAQLGCVERVLTVVADVRDMPAEQLAAPPWPLNKTTSVDECATAVVKGTAAMIACNARAGWPYSAGSSRCCQPRSANFPFARAAPS